MVRGLLATAFGLMVLVTACTAAPGPPPPAGGPPPANPTAQLPSSCTRAITTPDQTTAAVARVKPGDTLCLSGNALAAAELDVTTSGTAQAPITIAGDGATVRGVNVKADYVVVEGLAIKDGNGLKMTGRGLVARDNVIYNATDDGIACRDCVDTTLESNTVQRADGTGIWVAGTRITVRNNTVSGSVMRTGGDADGIRFFGNGHRFTGNTIKDIKASGYPGQGPHTDCFQTYNQRDQPPTYDVVIADNTCTNVDVQALIATNDDGSPNGPAGQTAITFERNNVSVNGSQAVLLRTFPRVIVRDNEFSGPGYRAVMLTGASTDTVVTGNTVPAPMRPYEIDQQSQPGFQESGNTAR